MVYIKKIKRSLFSGLLFSFFTSFITSPVVLAATQSDSTKLSEKNSVKSSYQKFYTAYQRDKTSPRAIHNFAVINYKLAHYDLAKTLFKKLLRHNNYELLAKYNLALVANKQGYLEESIYWFQRMLGRSGKKFATESVADKKLRLLAKIQIKKLKAEKAVISHSFSTNSYFFIKYGHDDNVIDPVGNVIDGDSYANFYGLLTLNFDNVYRGLKWRFSYYLKDYSTYNDDDFDQLSTDIAQHFKRGRWYSFIRAGHYQSTYDTTNYLSTTRLEFDTTYRAKGQQKYRAGLRFDDIKSEDPLYNIYEGGLTRLDLKYDKKVNAHNYRVRFSFENNDRADLVTTATPGTVNKSYSPGRQLLELSWNYKINKYWKSRFLVEYRISRYNDFSVDDSITREDQRNISKLQLQYKISRHWTWMIEASLEDNNSNISRYSYNQNIFNTGISGYF